MRCCLSCIGVARGPAIAMVHGDTVVVVLGCRHMALCTGLPSICHRPTHAGVLGGCRRFDQAQQPCCAPCLICKRFSAAAVLCSSAGSGAVLVGVSLCSAEVPMGVSSGSVQSLSSHDEPMGLLWWG